MKEYNRRRFLQHVVVGASALTMARLGIAEEAKETKEALAADDAYAKAMGFVLNTNDADSAKFPKHSTDQNCAKCQLWSGADGDDLGPCSFFGGRLTPRDGWCRNFKPHGAA
jgi:hypothetical protein